jgi:hypothetical protein
MHQSRGKRLNEECGWKRGTGPATAEVFKEIKSLHRSGSLMEVDFVPVKTTGFNSFHHPKIFCY